MPYREASGNLLVSYKHLIFFVVREYKSEGKTASFTDHNLADSFFVSASFSLNRSKSAGYNLSSVIRLDKNAYYLAPISLDGPRDAAQRNFRHTLVRFGRVIDH